MPSPELQGLILAGGEGSRLAAGGLKVPKPAIAVAGRPQLLRLAETLVGLGCPTVTCMVRDEFVAVAELLDRPAWRDVVRWHTCRTPSSLHTLVEGLDKVPAGPVLVTMVDTVMRAGHWRDVFAGASARLAAGADAVLAVTPFVDDEAALYVSLGAGDRVRQLSDQPLDPICVTGGVYAFAASVRVLAREAVGAGLSRMRNFLGRLVERGSVVAAVSVPRIIDLDRLADLQAANAWLEPNS